MLCLYSSFIFYLGKKSEKKNSGSGKRAHWLLCSGLTNDSMGIKVCASRRLVKQTGPVWAEASVYTDDPDRMTLLSRQQWDGKDGSVKNGRIDKALVKKRDRWINCSGHVVRIVRGRVEFSAKAKGGRQAFSVCAKQD